METDVWPTLDMAIMFYRGNKMVKIYTREGEVYAIQTAY